MATLVYNEAKLRWGDSSLDWNGDTIKARLCMTSTTYGTENDGKAFVADFTTDGVSDDTAYAGLGDITLTTSAAEKVDANDECKLDATNLQWTPLNGDASLDYQGVLIYKFVTNDAASVPICYIDFSADLTKLATTVNVTFDAEGVLNLN